VLSESGVKIVVISIPNTEVTHSQADDTPLEGLGEQVVVFLFPLITDLHQH